MSSPHADPSTGAADALNVAGPPLRRSSDDRVLLGVCGGLARRYGISALLLRIAFAVLALTGVSVAVYAVIAIACPAQDDPRPTGPVRVLGALVAGLVVLAVSTGLLHALGIGRYALGGGSVLVIVFLAGLGSALVLGRGRPIAAQTGAALGAVPRRVPRPQPPVLLFLTVAAAAVAATGMWFGTDGPGGEDAFGAILASVVVVIGLGVTLSAWRGRSFVLLPLGLALAAPLVLVAFADVSLTVGRDDPGVIRSADGSSRTVVLRQGAGPVEVRGTAVAAGLRTLVVRKGIGRVDVMVDRAVPVELEVVAVGGRVTVSDFANNAYTSFHTFRRDSMFLAAAHGAAPTAPLHLRVEVGFGSVLIEHGRPAAAIVPSLDAQLGVLRTGLVADIASRRGLLRADRRQLHRLTRAYAAQLRLLGRDPVASGRRTLRLAEAYWLAVTPSSPGLKAADPALARLDRLRALRFDLLRAGWRTHSVTRGLRTQRRRLRALERRIAAASTKEGRP